MEKINIVIPMAGAGSRFKKSGFKNIKPLIPLNGKTFIEWSIDSVDFQDIQTQFIFIIQEQHKKELYEYLKKIKPNCLILTVEKLTRGATETALIAKNYINNDVPLIITNCDQIFEWNKQKYLNYLQSNNVDGNVVREDKENPLQGANIILLGDNGKQYGATTDDGGRFSIIEVEDGSYKLSISFIGFEDYKENVIIVIGGDGFMLSTLKKYQNSKKTFYGVNSGNYGFLMNKFIEKSFVRNLDNSKIISISPLEMTVTTKKKIIRSIAINEVSILRQSRQAANLSIKINSKFLIKKLVSDGVLVSTPAGSTAYNLSVNGPILNLNSKKISIAPISAFRPRRWPSKLVSKKSKIIIKNLNSTKRPISAVADNKEVRNAKKITIKVQNKIKFNLLYNKNSNLEKKIKLEQLRKET